MHGKGMEIGMEKAWKRHGWAWNRHACQDRMRDMDFIETVSKTVYRRVPVP
jgi:hypothetical protein